MGTVVILAALCSSASASGANPSAPPAPGEKQFCCILPECGVCFDTPKGLTDHYESAHPEKCAKNAKRRQEITNGRLLQFSTNRRRRLDGIRKCDSPVLIRL